MTCGWMLMMGLADAYGLRRMRLCLKWGGKTPASLAREIFLDLDAWRACAPEPVAPRRVGGGLSQMASHGVIGKLEESARRPGVLVGDLVIRAGPSTGPERDVMGVSGEWALGGA